MRGLNRVRCAATLMVFTAVALGAPALAQDDQWAGAMAAFAAQDRELPPQPGGIVFVGSSSIRLWDVATSFPGQRIVNRGFGGSQIADAVRHVQVLVVGHQPRVVVFYAGDNDIAAGKSAETVAADFRTFVTRVHEALPATRIAFIGIKPSLLRWKLIEGVREANARIRDYCDSDDRLGFVDVDRLMIGWDGRPRADLLAEDGLHLSPKGYELWTILVRPFLE
jgi:lysophospholipase L1-like esterase